jgi:hypothetical protein
MFYFQTVALVLQYQQEQDVHGCVNIVQMHLEQTITILQIQFVHTNKELDVLVTLK